MLFSFQYKEGEAGLSRWNPKTSLSGFQSGNSVRIGNIGSYELDRKHWSHSKFQKSVLFFSFQFPLVFIMSLFSLPKHKVGLGLDFG